MPLTDDNLKRYVTLRDKMKGVGSWRERARICDPDAMLHAPVSCSLIQEAEQKLNIELPADLKEIYSESNGMQDLYIPRNVTSVHCCSR